MTAFATLIPIEPLGFDEAVNLALIACARNDVLTRWTNSSGRRRAIKLEFDPSGFPIRDEQRVTAQAPQWTCSPRSNGLEVTPVGITLTRCGESAAGSTGS